MDKLWALANLIGTIFLTALINKLISAFRLRQLYLSFDDVLECYEKGVSGFTATLILYNRGKDNESDIKVGLPFTEQIQVIAVDGPGVSTVGNEVLLDRLLSGDERKLSIYFKGEYPVGGSKKIYIRSDAANGKVYFKRGSVPQSVGPLFLTISFCIALFGLGVYASMTGHSPFDYYYKIRYGYMLEKGIVVGVAGDNALVAEGDRKAPKLDVMPALRDGKKIVFSFSVKNPFNKPIYAKVYTGIRSDYWDQYVKLRRQGIDPEHSKEMDLIKKKLWIGDYFEESSKEIKVLPGQVEVLSIKKVADPSADLSSLHLIISVEGEFDGGDAFGDFYNYYPSLDRNAKEILNLLKSEGQN